jgi:hypothetical protein
MACDQCKHIVDREDVPHVVRTCQNCGRVMHIHEPGKHGRGFKVNKGDQVVIPSTWLKLSPNPLKGTGQFTRAGLDWFARELFVGPLVQRKDAFVKEIDAMAEGYDQLLQDSALFIGLDLKNPEDADKAFELLSNRHDTVEWWAMASNVFLDILKDALRNNDAATVGWASACMERTRSMLLYKQHYEEVIWMGHSARPLVNALSLWSAHHDNSDEAFWQQVFTESSYVLAQVFSIPMVFIKDRAYVGGTNLDYKDGKLVDYLLAGEVSGEAALVEIKTPTAKLIGAKYRKTFQPHPKLAGAVMQALEYRVELIQSINLIAKGKYRDVSAFAPKCLLIIGNTHNELNTPEKRKAFEMFRGALKDVEIVTYDELFRKIEILASLFGLVKRAT